MLEQLFSSRTRVKLLRLFLSNPDESFYVRELTRRIKERINSVRRELANLEEIGVVHSETVNRKRYYRADTSFLLYRELRALILKAQVALERSMASEIQKVGHIRYMALTGVFTNVPEAKTDLLIVGQINRRRLKALMKKFQTGFSRELNYTAMSMQEYKYRRDVTDRFLYSVLDNPKIVLIDDV
ncbi:MAG: hypothetical protein HY341_01385 [Candidatus Kerfeldbacteria bacterium]|nr:hypothetical protein [Candidatus Kerfeldbacteria bacterium]